MGVLEGWGVAVMALLGLNFLAAEMLVVFVDVWVESQVTHFAVDLSDVNVGEVHGTLGEESVLIGGNFADIFIGRLVDNPRLLLFQLGHLGLEVLGIF